MPTKRVSLKGQGADLFFGGSQEPASPEEQGTEPPIEAVAPPVATGSGSVGPEDDRHQVATAPSEGPAGAAAAAGDAPARETAAETAEPDGYRASTQASYRDELTEAIRRVVKHTGREVSFVRLSAEEKGRLADIVYTYKRQSVRTSENEINRIAINLLLEDYDANGETSVLARVLASLQA